jgi:2',3'-cyclic-nucleotide 2'-phosphodiesterase (5'-nucleotidase family)
MPQLTLLHTNDLHAHFEQMTRIATLIQGERASANTEGRHVLLLDAGDSSSASAWESDVTGGRANYAMLEAMGYDAVAIGNSDAWWGVDALEKLLASVHFVSLAANLRSAANEVPPHLRGYALFRFEDISVAVVGLTTPETHPDLRIASPVETLRSLLPQLQAEGSQVVIVLSHLGVDMDQDLAAQVPGLPLIIGGHTHTILHKAIHVGSTTIVQTGSYGEFLGRVDLDYDTDTQTVTVINAQLIPCTPQTPPDPTLSGMLELIRFEADVVRKKQWK